MPKITDLKPQELNANRHKPRGMGQLEKSIQQDGWISAITVAADGETFDGSARLEVAADKFADVEPIIVDSDGSRPVVVRRTDIPNASDPRAKRLGVAANRVAELNLDWDADVLAEIASEVDLSGLFDSSLFDEPEIEQAETPEEIPLTRYDVPDALFPTDNEYGIPTLKLELQSTMLEAPLIMWGATTRKTRMRGTWAFYVDDYRFEALWADPSPVVNSGCVAVIEPNYTMGPIMPKAVALWHVYRKRWLARFWQEFGIKILVDMNVPEPHLTGENMLGVPQGWRAYATHGVSGDIGSTEHEYEVACERAGTKDILFVVYGGGKAAQENAMSRGWLWVPEHMQTLKGGVVYEQ